MSDGEWFLRWDTQCCLETAGDKKLIIFSMFSHSYSVKITTNI